MLPSLIYRRRTSNGGRSRLTATAVVAWTVAIMIVGMHWWIAPASAQTAGDPYATSGISAGYSSGPAIAIQGLPTWSGTTPTWLTGARFPNLGMPDVSNPFGYLPGQGASSTRLWLRAEYLYWVTEGMQTPALVTTSPDATAQGSAAILGLPNTDVLFGGGEINDDGTSGLRIKGGFFLNRSGAFGIEGEAFGLASQDDGFAASTGREIVGRPFYDTTNDRETAQLIDFPGVVDGSLSITSESKLRSFLLAGRASLCPTCGGNCVTCQNTDRVDWIVGYRHVTLEDSLSFSENLTSLDPAAPGEIHLSESFQTENEFNGLQLGVTYQANLRRVWLESLLRVAIGNNTQTARIRGQTSITEFGATETYDGGLLAQRFNSGTFEREQFTMIPEVGLTLGVRLFDWLYATGGYSLIYLPAVIRAGDQIDTDVNPGLLPPEDDPLTGSNRPRFRFIESDYWAHGLNVGLQMQF